MAKGFRSALLPLNPWRNEIRGPKTVAALAKMLTHQLQDILA